MVATDQNSDFFEKFEKIIPSPSLRSSQTHYCTPIKKHFEGLTWANGHRYAKKSYRIFALEFPKVSYMVATDQNSDFFEILGVQHAEAGIG